jgi:hypothetical protein
MDVELVESRVILTAYFDCIEWELRKLIHSLPPATANNFGVPLTHYLPRLVHTPGDGYRSRVIDSRTEFGHLHLHDDTAVVAYYTSWSTATHRCLIADETETVAFAQKVARSIFNQLCTTYHWQTGQRRATL